MSKEQEYNSDHDLVVLAKRLLLTRGELQASPQKLKEIAYELADKVIATNGSDLNAK